MDATHCGFDSFWFQKFVPNTHSKNCLILDFNLSDHDFKVSLAVVSVDLSEEMILCSIRPVGVLVMTGMARGPLTVSGTTVAELMKG